MIKAQISKRMNRAFILHVGMQKTGTTTLQSLLFPNHEDIYYLGKEVSWSATKGCRNADIYRFLSPSIWPDDEASCRVGAGLTHERVFHDITGSQVLLGSWEELASRSLNSYLDCIRSLVDRFETCRVMICLRNPLNLLPSLYLQSLRGRESKKSRGLLRGGWYCDIDTWLERWHDAGGFEGHLAYGDRIRETIQLLGRDNVGVFLFEDLCKDQKQFIRAVCRFIGIDDKQGVSLASQGHLHTRLTQDQVDFLRRIDHSFWKRIVLSRLSPKRQRELIERFGGSGPPARVELSETWRERIAEATRQGNRWLMDSLQLPLDQYRYPV